MTDFSTLAKGQRLAGLSLSLLPPFHKLPPKVFRFLFSVLDRLCGLNSIKMKRIDNISIPVDLKGSINLRLYEATTGSKKTMVFFHSGGCVIGGINTHDRFCRHLAHYGECTVISVDYRLAPEYKFPVPITDTIQAWNWILDNHKQLNINTDRIGVGGDSAGGYLSVLLNLTADQQSLPVQVKQQPHFQMVLFPMLDQRGKTESYKAFTKHLILTQGIMHYFTEHYLNSLEEANTPLGSPLLSEHLKDCPKTYLLTVEYDPLRDEGQLFADRLKDEGVDLNHQHFDDCMHSFFSSARFSPRAKRGVLEVCQTLKSL